MIINILNGDNQEQTIYYEIKRLSLKICNTIHRILFETMGITKHKDKAALLITIQQT